MNSVLQWLLGSRAGQVESGGQWRVGFLSEYSNYIHLGLLILAGAMIWLVVRSYRREGSTPRKVKMFLAALRIAVILLILAILLRPAIILRYTRTLYSAVVLLVDDSKSMSFADRYAEDPNTQRQLAELLEPNAADLSALSRRELMTAILAREDGPLAKLAKDHPLIFMRYSTAKPGRESYTRLLGEIDLVSSGQQMDSQELYRQASGQIRQVLSQLEASGFETNSPAALRSALERSRGRRVAAFVTISDGQDTAKDAATRLPGVLAYGDQVGFTRYALLVGDTTEPRNLSVVALRAPREVRRGEQAEFSVMLAHRNLTGQRVTVLLDRKKDGEQKWETTSASADVDLTSEEEGAQGRREGRGVQSVSLTLEPSELGEFMYRARVEPREDEENASDNVAEAPVKVSDEKVRILLVSGDAGWEFQYLRNLLLRQPDFYRLSTWQQTADKEVNQTASSGMRLEHLPRELVELIGSPGGDPHPGYDVVILLDPKPTEGGFDTEFVDMLKTYVSKHGGGLCYVAGNKHTEEVARDASLFKALLDLLPVYVAPNTISVTTTIMGEEDEAWPVQPTTYGVDHPVMRIAGGVDESREVWGVLPGIYWTHPVDSLKPAARVLAVNANPARRTDDGTPEPLMVLQPFGSGRVMYVGFDATRRWRYLNDGGYHQRFWANVMRYLATVKARQVVISTGGDRFSAGEKITVEVEAYDENFKPRTDEQFVVWMLDAQTGQALQDGGIVCKAVEDRPGQYKADLTLDRTGTFDLTALRDDPDAADKVDGKRIVVELPRAESLRSEADAQRMRAIASRGEYFLPLAQADRLGQIVPVGRLTAINDVPRELWDTKLALLALTLLLVVEWVLRKKYNMA